MLWTATDDFQTSMAQTRVPSTIFINTNNDNKNNKYFTINKSQITKFTVANNYNKF